MENYKILGTIGRGGFGQVKAALDRNGEEVAIKRVYCREIGQWVSWRGRRVPMEAACLQALHGVTGIPRLINHFRKGDHYFLVMEKPRGVVNLREYQKEYGAMSEADAKTVFRQLLAILWNVREAGIVHRDIKLQNVLIRPDTLDTFLIDFGLAMEITDRQMRHFEGTREYAPPEYFKRKAFYTEDAESWSLGVMLYSMVAGRHPFESIGEVLLKKALPPKGSSRWLRRALKQTLCRDPESRITLDQLMLCPWLTADRKK